MSYSRIHHRITIPPQKIDHSPPPGGASPGIAHSLVTVTMPVHRSRCPAAFPHAARFFSTLHRTRLAAHSRPRPLAIGSCCLRSLPLPAAESFWLRYPRSLGAIILQAAWDCCGIWPSPSRAHADPARFVAAHDPPRLLATPSPPPAPALAIGTLAIGFTALFFICAARSRGSHIFAAAPGLPPAARAFGSDTDY